MILHRIRAWLERPPADVLAARETSIAQLRSKLAAEEFISARLGADVDRLNKENNDLTARLRAEQTEVQRLSTAGPLTTCECGGDAELHWRRRVVDAEQRAARDRANCNVMADRLAKAEGRPVIGSVA